MELKYMDKVRVTKGFYEGLEGIVTDRGCVPHIGTQYYVEMEAVQNGLCVKTPSAWIDETRLEKIEGEES